MRNAILRNHLSCKRQGHKTVQKGNPYQQGVQKERNTLVYPVDITPLHTNINARMEYYTVMTAIWLKLKSASTLLRRGVPARRFSMEYLSPLPLNVQNLVGNSHFSLDVWTWNKQNVHKTLQTLSAYGSPPCFFPTKSVLSLARPHFLARAIIVTRFQDSLQVPPPAGLDSIQKRNLFMSLYLKVNLEQKHACSISLLANKRVLHAAFNVLQIFTSQRKVQINVFIAVLKLTSFSSVVWRATLIDLFLLLTQIETEWQLVSRHIRRLKSKIKLTKILSILRLFNQSFNVTNQISELNVLLFCLQFSI